MKSNIDISVRDLKILDDKFKEMRSAYKTEHMNLRHTLLDKEPGQDERRAFLETSIPIFYDAIDRIERYWLLQAIEIRDAEKITVNGYVKKRIF